jgi:sugar transferase (PEP-CTERM system associated)
MQVCGRALFEGSHAGSRIWFDSAKPYKTLTGPLAEVRHRRIKHTRDPAMPLALRAGKTMGRKSNGQDFSSTETAVSKNRGRRIAVSQPTTMVRVFHQFVPAKILLLFSVESGAMLFAFLFASKLFTRNVPFIFGNQALLPEFVWQALLGVVILQICFYCNDLYNVEAFTELPDLGLRVLQSVGAACILLGFLFYLIPVLVIQQSVLLLSMALILAFALVTRTLVAGVRHTPVRVAILGTGIQAQRIAREIANRESLGFVLAGFISTDPEAVTEGQTALGKPVLRDLHELDALMRTQTISRVVVATEERRGSLPIRNLVRLRMLGIQIEDASSFVSALTGRIWLDMVRPSWFVFSDGFRRSRFTELWKRAVDLTFALLGAAISLPILFIAGLAIWLESGSPIFYRQTRVGRNGKLFELIKLRSMCVDAEADGKARWAQENDVRVTRLGAILRKYRIDELPQFFNVIRGDMSFVGPRPERPAFVEEFREEIPYYDERHLIRPGITGWAQVEAPYGASKEDTIHKLEYDLFYLKNLSFTFDCLIIFATLRTVLMGRGAR